MDNHDFYSENKSAPKTAVLQRPGHFIMPQTGLPGEQPQLWRLPTERPWFEGCRVKCRADAAICNFAKFEFENLLNFDPKGSHGCT